jgi:HptB-dependent secretion and biofilm anti anti-sigma factor
MMIASQTLEVQPSRCHVCGSEVKNVPVVESGDAPCPRCGYLQWFTWEDLGDVEVIRPIEDLLKRDSLDHFLDSVALKPGIHLILDLSDVHFVASAALGRLVGLKKRVHGVGGRFTIRHVCPELMEIFRITRLDHVFDMQTS